MVDYDFLDVKIKKKNNYSMHFISEFDLDLSDIAETAVMGVYVIVGLVVGGIILLIIVVVIVICCCCKRQGASSGQVYRNQQPASQPVSQPPPSAYPQVQYSAVSPQAAGYQPPPAQGYNPTPQGYNPPTGQMAGYPPQAGYQPPPQGYGAPPPAQGYQMAETQKMPSGRDKYEFSPLFMVCNPVSTHALINNVHQVNFRKKIIGLGHSCLAKLGFKKLKGKYEFFLKI